MKKLLILLLSVGGCGPVELESEQQAAGVVLADDMPEASAMLRVVNTYSVTNR